MSFTFIRGAKTAWVLASIAALMWLMVVVPQGWADPFSDLKSSLQGASNGDTVTLGEEEIDLAGGRINVGSSDVTLKGSVGMDFGQAIRSTVEAVFGSGFELTKENLTERLNALSQNLLDNLPKSRIYNTAAKALTTAEVSSGLHSGISGPGGGFSLSNLTFSGTNVNAVRNSAYSSSSHVYLGLISPDLNREHQSSGNYATMGLLENVAFVNNVTNADSNVNVEGNTIFATQRHYNSAGAYVTGQDRTTSLEGIKGSLFYGNKTIIAPPTASGDTGNRLYSGAGLGWFNVGYIDSSLFIENSTYGGHHSFGGAIYAATIDTVSNSIFMNNSNTGDHDAYGGALMAGTITNMTNTIFIGNFTRGITTPGGFVGGTAVAGGAVNGAVWNISDSLFAFNQSINDVADTAGEKEALGGAISSSRIESITNTSFIGNSVIAKTSGGEAFGGAINLTPNTTTVNSIVITDSIFVDNSASANAGEAAGGAIRLAPTNINPYTLTLAATNGGTTLFEGNTVDGEANSLFIGSPSGTGLITLNISAAQNGFVKLLDPIEVVRPANASFDFAIAPGGGVFQWGGENEIEVSGTGAANVTLSGAGVTTILSNDFSLVSAPSGNAVSVTPGSGHISLNIEARDLTEAFFKDVHFTSTPSNIYIEHFSLENAESLNFTFAESSTGLSAFEGTVTDPVTGTVSKVVIGANGQATFTYQGPKELFNKSGVNAILARPALIEAWNQIKANLEHDQLREYFAAILADLPNLTAEPYVAQANIATSMVNQLASLALSANSTSRLEQLAQNTQTPAAGAKDPGFYRVWGNYFSSIVNQDTADGKYGYRSHLRGGVLGASFNIVSDLELGAWASVGTGKTTYKVLSSKADYDVVQGGIFLDYRPDNGFQGTLDLSLAKFSTDVRRLAIGNLYLADYDQNVFGLGFQAGYSFGIFDGGTLTPYVGLRYSHIKQDAISEREINGNNVFSAVINAKNYNSVISELGVKFEANFKTGIGDVSPFVMAGWRHEFDDDGIDSAYRFRGFGAQPTRNVAVAQSNKREDAALLGVGLSISPQGETGPKINISYNGAFSSDHKEHFFQGGLEYRF
ncbi:MAG: autotransporter domain-containing protein [Deltaproteobacteria bacterium]|jgi:hypothetical protein|nr:autotransporter domain-containing protein [Deltaproteobacteria bacterium]